MKCFYIQVIFIFERKCSNIGLEKFALEQTEKIVEHEQISRETLRILLEIASRFEEFTAGMKSPWKDALEKVAKNGNTVIIGKAGAKLIENPAGETLVCRRFLGYGPDLPDGTPTLRFKLVRPSGETRLIVKPNVNGTFSPVRLQLVSDKLAQIMKNIAGNDD